MADDKFVRIGISIDKSGAQQAAQTVDTVRKEFDTVKLSATQAGNAASQAARVTDGGWKPVRRTIQDVNDDVEDTRRKFSQISQGGSSFFRGISGLTGGALGEIAQTSQQIEEVTRGFQKMTSQGIGPLLQSLGPTVIAGAALSVGLAGVSALINAYNQGLETQKAQLKEELTIRQELRELSRKATTEEAQAKRDAAQQSVDDIKATIQELKDAQSTLGKGAGFIEWNQKIEANRQALDEQQKALEAAQKRLEAYNKALNDSAFAGGDAVKSIEEQLEKETKFASMREWSTTQLQKRLNDLQQEGANVQNAYMQMNEQVKAGNQAAIAPAAELAQRLADMREEIEVITKSMLPAAKAQETLVEATRKATEATKALKQAQEDAFRKVQQRNSDLANAQEKYESDVANIEEQSLQKRADIQQKYNDTLVSIAEKAAQDAEDRLAKLEQTRADLASDYAEGETEAAQKAALERVDVQIKAQRDERDALQDHLRALEEIRRNAQLREQGFLLDRNFLGLLQSRQQAAADIEDENRKYIEAQQDRKQAIQDQVQDTARAFEQERQTRLQAYQRQLADAQSNYNREAAEAQKARQKELELAVLTRNRSLQEEAQSAQQQLAARRKLHIQELQDIYDYGARKLKAERDFLQKALDMIKTVNIGARTPSSGARYTPTQYADGGPMPADRWGIVNDSGTREQFNGVPFPSGLGMFYPLQPGYVSNVRNSKQSTINLTQNITGTADPVETARIAREQAVSVMERVMRN